MNLFERLQQAQNQKIAANKKGGEDFLAANAVKEGVIVLSSGLQYKVIKEGTGNRPVLSNTVTCHYHGTLISGEVFDSSVIRKQPAIFPLQAVIKGWQEGLQLMPAGSTCIFYIPSHWGYGDKQAGNKIMPGSTLIFEVELLGIS